VKGCFVYLPSSVLRKKEYWSWSGVAPRGHVSDKMLDFADFLPTIAEAGGAEPPDNEPIDGRSFLPILEGKEQDRRDWLYCWYQIKGGYRYPERLAGHARVFTFDRRWKLYDEGKLYDMRSDPREKNPIGPGEGDTEAKAAREKLGLALESVHRRLEE